MKDKYCPYCKSEDLYYGDVDNDWISEEDLIVRNECLCRHCGKEFNMMESFDIKDRWYEDMDQEDIEDDENDNSNE